MLEDPSTTGSEDVVQENTTSRLNGSPNGIRQRQMQTYEVNTI